MVIAAHNYGAFLGQAVASVQAQTCADWECVIVDDASTDSTRSVAEDLAVADRRIRYVRNETNLGEARTRNLGATLTRGTFIAPLDADDWWHPEKLQRQLAAADDRPDAVLSFAAPILMPGNRAPCAPGYFAAWASDFESGLRRQNCVYHSSVLVRRFALEAVGGYDEGLPYGVDWDLWLRLLERFGGSRLRLIDEPLIYYRLHDGSMSRRWDIATRGTRAVAVRHLLRRGWAWRHPRSAWRALDEQLWREVDILASAGQPGRAARTGALWAGLSPFRRWRWQRLRQRLLAGAGAP